MMGLRKGNLHFFIVSNSINLKFAEVLHFKQQRNVLHLWLASDSLLNAEEMVVAKLQELKENQALVNVVVDTYADVVITRWLIELL